MLTFQKLNPHRFSQQQPQHHEPQRLSGVYQYHNAPEVLPEHGLEYDDNVYPVSDKYPVTSMDDYPASFRAQQYRDTNNRPPRIIFGMKMRSFLLVAFVFVLIVVGAVVGGTVGHSSSHATGTEALANESSPSSTTLQSSGGVRTIAASEPTTASMKPTISATASSTALSTPTFIPLSACPSANNTLYTSNPSTNSSLNPSDNATTVDLTYTRYCDANKPTDFKPLTSGFVYTFDDCIELCATYNVYAVGSSNCNVAVYDVQQARPVNCVVGSAQNASASSLGVDGGLAVALLNPST
ncbi:uncharacterized protein M437DRAFT_57505 [Aureobasidium melanogenum CBS 110374]|uniref:Apple domain-containing protein n=1 Tax=Aureobasidium melanogenum (strain CBS 110374) TaxID=1043003 RepID=A0A074W9R3_AURM1|nr:uncharacterized protein M437DRAFT_57505 [Aureobasidium melanogenum CBS 110374]KEQ59276.1 hypothetical protein M437DRAFT_57505 [Aureobasidium melanogenum CBS 110374]